jgi:hypothetical protein
VFWTHPDGDEPYLYAVDASGSQIGRVQLGRSRLIDWEDVSLSPCGSSDCLYLADTGDNSEARRALRVYRIREPDPRVDTIVSVQAFVFVLPDGPRDIEAMFVMPGEHIYLVSKGLNDPVSVYRHPGPLDVDSFVVLDEVQKLGDDVRVLPRQVTGAAASADGKVVVIRTYEVLDFYRMNGDTLEPLDERRLNLRTLREAQGEGVGIGEDGLIALTSEAGPIGRRGSMVLVRCDIAG